MDDDENIMWAKCAQIFSRPHFFGGKHPFFRGKHLCFGEEKPPFLEDNTLFT